MTGDLSKRFIITLFAWALVVSSSLAHAECLDVNQTGRLAFEGTLTFHVFGGPPYNGGVRLGDTPEPTYVLKLDEPICATGDEFVDPNTAIEQIQIYPEDAEDRELSRDLRRLVGQRVRVEGKSAFGAHTGHHHAPLLLPITRVKSASEPIGAYGTAMTTVQAFYLALAAGNGEEAASFLIPQKRASGPLSAHSITNFYFNLEEPLTLIDIVPAGSDEFRVRYTFAARAARRCDGVAIVKTTQIRGENLIASIEALNGC
jgi:hypothetical protein